VQLAAPADTQIISGQADPRCKTGQTAKGMAKRKNRKRPENDFAHYVVKVEEWDAV
jgi:hypothetical protein